MRLSSRQRQLTNNTSSRLTRLCSALVLLLMTMSSQVVWPEDEIDFTLPDVEGKVHSLSDFRGEWVVVNFWATWCSPCIKEIPELNELTHLVDPTSVIVIGIDFEEIDTAPLKKFLSALKVNYLVLRIGQQPLVPFEPLKGLPTTFLVSPQGKIVYTKVGPTTKDMLIEQLRIQLDADKS